jgi:Tat protein secretion system quality control protein TatD with DNase activity
VEVVKKLAEIRGVEAAAFAEQLMANKERLYQIV